jgi:hypothetical protein
MRKIQRKEIVFDQSSHFIIIKGERFDISKVFTRYQESKFFSYLEIIIENRIYLVKGLKSIWEHLKISTYDSYEKREDNKVYDLYKQINYLKNN